MRDLTARLRDIVRQDHGGGRPSPVRELTYVPDTDGLALDPERAARALGGVPAAPGTGCIVIDRVWEPHDWHGRHAVRAFVATPTAPLGLFDSRAAGTEGWARRIVFFDLETTGLSGGAGTLAFLAGCGWFEGEAFRVRQFFLSSPAGERAMLAELAKIFDEASLVVTYNGRSFDMPLMETRWAFHRTAAPTDDLPHFDMLPPARRLWGRRELRGSDDEAEAPEAVSCSLTALERSVLGFHRVGDVPGFEIPARYFHFLRTGDGAAVMGVLDHNRHDLLSLAGVMARALQLAEDGPDGCRDETERLALGRVYERAGDHARAIVSFDMAARGLDRDVRRHALARLAALLARDDRHDEAAAAWRGVLDLARPRAPLSALDRRAVEALAIHHEHRARDLSSARQFAEQLNAGASGRAQQSAAHRLGRIDRKLQGRGKLL
jgi:uncharacterized protein YprB with RNaseH-like and TPR domain